MTEKHKPERYDPVAVEARWQERWAASDLYRIDLHDTTRPPYYFLTMLPYPSGDLHIGHWFTMAPSDTRARYLFMRGYNVFYPIGFDAFGLPAENSAIKRNLHPKQWTYANIANMRRQLRSMGAIFPWDYEVVTCDPEYYRWNQWFFIQFFKRGLAYRKFAPVDWCPSCNTTLAREQVVGDDRHCERCDTPVIKKDLFQWLFKITAYAEELLDFSHLQWPERVQTLQRNWIGRSQGAEVVFTAQAPDGSTVPITIFTTRPDTLWGTTFLVLAPEHPLVAQLTAPEQSAALAAYVAEAGRQTEIDRLAEDKEKTGLPLGTYAINPVNGKLIPIWTADYVLPGYGTGAIMAVPAHDQRDFEFARKFDLPIVPLIKHDAQARLPLASAMTAAYTGEGGTVVRSGPISGTTAGYGPGQSVEAAIAYLERESKGKGAVSYRLRDWLISRQRYWGTPIPIVYCAQCGEVPVPDEQLPVTLPEDVDFRPTGESPLKLHESWRFTTCPRCGGPAERDTDTMDTFVDSSWYQYRYLSPHYAAGPFDPKHLAAWLPVTQYTGGIEHAVMHLLYTRFWTKAMRDLGLVDFGEPMIRLFNQGIILGPDGFRMSKSRGNVVDPDELVRRYGADAVRCFLMFIGPWDRGGPWDTRGIEGITRWLRRVWSVAADASDHGTSGEMPASELQRQLHRTIRSVGEDTDSFHFNTAISAMMELTNTLMKLRGELSGTDAWENAVRAFLLLLAPYAPHLAEELWARRGYPYSVHQQAWPAWDPTLVAIETVEVPVQMNGRVRDKIQAPAGSDSATLEKLALASAKIQALMNGKPARRVIVVPGRLINIIF